MGASKHLRRGRTAHDPALLTGMAIVAIAIAVLGGVAAVLRGSEGIEPRAVADPSEALASVLPAGEPVGAVGEAAVQALQGVRPVVMVDDAGHDLPGYVVTGATRADRDAWAVQEQLQSGGRVELVVPAGTGGSVLRVVRTDEAAAAAVEEPTGQKPSTGPEPQPSASEELPPAPPATPAAAATPDNSSGTGVNTYVVVAGQSLWNVAAEHAQSQLGRAGSLTEIQYVLASIIELNRAALPDAANPDLVFPGTTLTLS